VASSSAYSAEFAEFEHQILCPASKFIHPLVVFIKCDSRFLTKGRLMPVSIMQKTSQFGPQVKVLARIVVFGEFHLTFSFKMHWRPK
jgi:hypothetical protein